MCSPTCLLAVLAILFPPLPVWVCCGLCSIESIICIALSVFGYLPGLIYALYIISVAPADGEVRSYYARINDAENGEASVYSYYYVQTGAPGPQQPGGNIQSYGTVPAPTAVAVPAQPQGQVGASSSAAADVPPPAYSETVPGDNKIQRT